MDSWSSFGLYTAKLRIDGVTFDLVSGRYGAEMHVWAPGGLDIHARVHEETVAGVRPDRNVLRWVGRVHDRSMGRWREKWEDAAVIARLPEDERDVAAAAVAGWVLAKLMEHERPRPTAPEASPSRDTGVPGPAS